MPSPTNPPAALASLLLEILRTSASSSRPAQLDVHQSALSAVAEHLKKMSAPSRALRRCICTANASYLSRPATATLAQQRTSRRRASTEAAASSNPKIATIVDQISQLTLLETADLVSTLKVRHRRYNPRAWQMLRAMARATSYIRNTYQASLEIQQAQLEHHIMPSLPLFVPRPSNTQSLTS